jgi:hypothetical protein
VIIREIDPRDPNRENFSGTGSRVGQCRRFSAGPDPHGFLLATVSPLVGLPTSRTGGAVVLPSSPPHACLTPWPRSLLGFFHCAEAGPSFQLLDNDVHVKIGWPDWMELSLILM